MARDMIGHIDSYSRVTCRDRSHFTCDAYATRWCLCITISTNARSLWDLLKIHSLLANKKRNENRDEQINDHFEGEQLSVLFFQIVHRGWQLR